MQLLIESKDNIILEKYISTIGEGVVWHTKVGDNVFRMKVKGLKHSSSKVKSLAPVDPVKLASIKEFVEYSVTDNRLEQGIVEVFTVNNIEPNIKMIGSFIRWVIGDIMKEEIESLVESNLIAKDVNKNISFKARDWFFKNYVDL